jgi:hypothetical protein
MILKLLNWQGIAGIALSLALGVMLAIEKGETHHWKKASAGFEQLYHQDQAAFATTVSNYRSAADQARAADKANLARVAAEQQSINEWTANDYEARLAAARAAAQRLRLNPEAAADPRPGRSASMPGLSAAASGAARAPDQDGLPPSDALTATEQAIQLDELIKWVRAQAKVDNNAPAVASPSRH